MINENVVEIRFKPNAKILDYRGVLAESVASEMKLSQWQIESNRVDIFDEEQTIRTFISFRNAGFILRNIDLGDFFSNKAAKFFNHLFRNPPFQSDIFIERIGVRSRFATPQDADFPIIIDRYIQNIVSPNKKLLNIFESGIIDISLPINFENSQGKMNTNSGMMNKAQLSGFFQLEKEENLPENAFYFDIDYYKEVQSVMKIQAIIDIIKSFASQNWEKYSKMKNLILEENDLAKNLVLGASSDD